MMSWMVRLVLVCVGLGLVGARDDDYPDEKVVERIPVFTTPSLRRLVNEGDRIRLPCFVDRLEGFVLLWKKGETILSVGERVISQDNGRTSLEAEKEGNWLVVEDARLEDGGEYTCHISAFHPQEISHSVKIRTRPAIRNMVDVVDASEGENATLSCILTAGEPTPEISWSKSGSVKPGALINSFGPDLNLVNVTWESAGVYQCTADNGFVTSSSADVRFQVRHKPYILRSDQFVHSSPGLGVKLSCTVPGYPEPSLNWFRGGFALSSLQYNMSRIGTKYSLYLNPEEATLGNYSCNATNTLGSDLKSIVVSNKVVPIEFVSAPISESDDEYLLQWVGTSGVEVSKYILITSKEDGSEMLEIELKPGSQTGLSWPAEFKLTGLEPATVYKAQVSGVNENGAGPFTQFIFGTQGTSFNPESGKLVSSSPARFGVSFILCIVSLLLFIS